MFALAAACPTCDGPATPLILLGSVAVFFLARGAVRRLRASRSRVKNPAVEVQK